MVQVTGTVLGTFDPTLVESEVAQIVGNYIGNGSTDSPLLGGSRSAAELRDQIRANVPGVSALNIPVFARKQVAPLVENIDIPRNSQLTFETTDDLLITFT